MNLTDVLLAILAVGVGILCLLARSILHELRRQTPTLDKIFKLQLNPRTRMATAHVQSGPVTEEQSLRKLARVSASKRVVFGGDEASEQYQRLNPTNPAMVDNE